MCSERNASSGIAVIAYILSHDQIKSIWVKFTPEVMAEGGDVVLKRAKSEYGEPIKEKDIVKSTLSLEQQRELLGREPELGNNSMAWAVRQAIVAARYETI